MHGNSTPRGSQARNQDPESAPRSAQARRRRSGPSLTNRSFLVFAKFAHSVVAIAQLLSPTRLQGLFRLASVRVRVPVTALSMEGFDAAPAATHVAFKKPARRGNARKRERAEDDEEDAAASGAGGGDASAAVGPRCAPCRVLASPLPRGFQSCACRAQRTSSRFAQRFARDDARAPAPAPTCKGCYA